MEQADAVLSLLIFTEKGSAAADWTLLHRAQEGLEMTQGCAQE